MTMRLTLRTMLAYLDDILEPDDTEDIRKKIDESEFATNLMHRTRDCVRRLRLGVPAIMGRGLGADPNSVAEYLDNTLASERVPEFEKICLESDVHLAEVAACHQVLTLVLGEQAEIDAESRQRMYQVAAQVDAPPVQSDAPRAAATGAAPPPVGRRVKPEVPDYLRETRSRMWPVAAMIAVGAMLAFGGLVAFGPSQFRERLTAMVGAGPGDAETEPVGDTEPATDAMDDHPAGQSPSEPADNSPTEASASPPPNEVAAESPDDRRADDEAAPAVPGAAPDAKMPDDAGDALNTTPGPAQPNPLKTTPDDGGAPPPPEPKLSSEDQAASDAVGIPIPSVVAPPSSLTGKGSPPPGLAPLESGRPLPLPKGGSSERPLTDEGSGKAEGGEAFGRYISKHEVLLKFNRETKNWSRLPPMSPLAKGDRLLSLPLFRPAVTLSSSITISADGAALFELTGWTEEGAPIVKVEYGRLLMLTVGRPANPLQLRVGDAAAELTFVDAESTLAVEVRHVLPAGKDPEEGSAPVAVDLYATSGPIRVRDDGSIGELQAPAHQSLLTGRRETPTDLEFPKWVTSESLSTVDRSATSTVEPLLLPDRPVDLILKEQSTTHRKFEVRLLAIRSLGCLDNFDACVAALNDKDEKNSWPAYFDELRAAVARSPQTAAAVRGAFEKQRGADAAKLYRMLWGYSANDLKNGADAELVDGLSNLDALDVRVLAFLNLTRITGFPSFGYNPADQAIKRVPAVKKWKAKQTKGEIMPNAANPPTKSKAVSRTGNGSS
jgi:hypothetical protein